MKTMPSTFTMALSRVMTSWVGTSRTCSIMFMRRPIRSTNGVRMWMPGVRVLVYLPNRSTVNSRPCGTILITLNRKMSAKTANITKNISEKFIRPSSWKESLTAPTTARYRIRFRQHDIRVSHRARDPDNAARLFPVHLGQSGLERKEGRLGRIVARDWRARQPPGRIVDQNVMSPRLRKEPVHHIDQTDQFLLDAGFLPQFAQGCVSQTFARLQTPAGQTPFPHARRRAATDQQHIIAFQAHHAHSRRRNHVLPLN